MRTSGVEFLNVFTHSFPKIFFVQCLVQRFYRTMSLNIVYLVHNKASFGKRRDDKIVLFCPKMASVIIVVFSSLNGPIATYITKIF